MVNELGPTCARDAMASDERRFGPFSMTKKIALGLGLEKRPSEPLTLIRGTRTFLGVMPKCSDKFGVGSSKTRRYAIDKL